METFSRRELAAIAVTSLAALSTKADLIAQAPPAREPDWYQAALASHKENSGILARFPIPMSTEPAFQFKA